MQDKSILPDLSSSIQDIFTNLSVDMAGYEIFHEIFFKGIIG